MAQGMSIARMRSAMKISEPLRTLTINRFLSR